MNEKEILRQHFSKLGKAGGKKGGKARMSEMTDEQRRELAQLGAAARWSSVMRKELLVGLSTALAHIGNLQESAVIDVEAVLETFAARKRAGSDIAEFEPALKKARAAYRALKAANSPGWQNAEALLRSAIDAIKKDSKTRT